MYRLTQVKFQDANQDFKAKDVNTFSVQDKTLSYGVTENIGGEDKAVIYYQTDFISARVVVI